MLECSGPDTDRRLAAAPLTTARSDRRGWAAGSPPRLPSDDRRLDEAIRAYLEHDERRRCEKLGRAKHIECDAQVDPPRWCREQPAARDGPLIDEAIIPLRLGDAATYLLARTGFATTGAGTFVFVGPSGQEDSTSVLAGDFPVSLHVGASPAAKDSWWV